METTITTAETEDLLFPVENMIQIILIHQEVGVTIKMMYTAMVMNLMEKILVEGMT